jgi:quinol monooxygenase YgiN
MRPSVLLFSGVLSGVMALSVSLPGVGQAQTQTGGDRVVRIAEIEVEPQQVETYRAALREEIEASIRLEPGVLMLYALAVKGHPEQVRMVEVYANQGAYEAHLQTSHFKKYKAATLGMVRSLKLIETEPILLGAKEAGR